MKVLHINCNYLGSALHQAMIEKLDSLGIENTVFVPVYSGTEAVITPNNQVVVSDCFRKRDRLLFDYKQKKIIAAIEKRYDVSRFDLIHAYTLFTDGNAARVLAGKYGVPFLAAVRNTDVNIFFKKMIHLRRRGLLTMKNASRIFFLSRAYRNQVLERYVPASWRADLQDRCRLIPNGIDDFWIKNRYWSRPVESIEKRIGEKKLRLVYAGGIDKNKNIPLTCAAAEILRKNGWSVEFDVIGSVRDIAEYAKIAGSPHCHYHEACSKESLIEFYRSADIFVMASHTESFGLVYAEAMSQGLPVIYTRGQGFDGQFEDGLIGCSVSGASADEMAQKIRTICRNYRTLSSSCVQCAEKFQWDRIADEYHQIYRTVAENRLSHR